MGPVILSVSCAAEETLYDAGTCLLGAFFLARQYCFQGRAPYHFGFHTS
jgi:hypothetical protein